VASALASPVLGLGVQPQAAADAWRFEITPYLWAASLDGSIGFGSLPDVEVDASFDDLFENVDFAAATFFTARKGRWSILADVSYVGLDIEETVGASTVEIDSAIYWGALAGGYALDTNPGVGLDLFAGLRYYAVDNDARSSGGVVGERSDTEAWIDPLVGFVYSNELGHGFAFHFLADVGGFGVGSDLTWEAMPSLSLRLNEALALRLAYRWMDVDYEDSDFAYDVTQEGFALGLSFAF
jgi:hypothetical protein